MKTFGILSVVALIAALGTPAMAAPSLEIDYQNLDLTVGAGGSISVVDRANSIASAALDSTGDTADIFNIIAGQSFDLDFTGSVVNGGGIDDIVVSATFAATDNGGVIASPAVLASFTSANLTGDLDGVSFGSGVLRIEGMISTIGPNPSILVSPVAGDWVYAGGPNGTPAGLDGVADQLTISDSVRDNYDTGVLAVLEISLSEYADGTSTAGLNADQLFDGLAAHGGFGSTSAQIQLSVIPAPAAAVLGFFGLGIVGWVKRRLA